MRSDAILADAHIPQNCFSPAVLGLVGHVDLAVVTEVEPSLARCLALARRGREREARVEGAGRSGWQRGRHRAAFSVLVLSAHVQSGRLFKDVPLARTDLGSREVTGFVQGRMKAFDVAADLRNHTQVR